MEEKDEKRDKILNEVEEELEEEINILESQISKEKKTKELLENTGYKPKPDAQPEHKQEPKLVVKTAKTVLQTPNVADRMPRTNSIFDYLLPVIAVLLIIALSFFLYGLFS